MYQKVKSQAAVTVASAGTRVQVSSSDIDAWTIIIQAEKTNTNNIYIGDITVSSSNGIILAAGESFTIDAHILGDEAINLSDLYIDTDTGGNKARVVYLTVRGS